MKVILAFLTSITLIACGSRENNKVLADGKNASQDSANFTTVRWLDSAQQIGTLQMGEVAQIKFRFKNVGDKPLFIISAEPGCGCTVADYPKEAIGKGKEGEIVAAFDTNKGMVGGFRKSINVKTNTTPGSAYLFFEGEIVSKNGEGEVPTPVESKQ